MPPTAAPRSSETTRGGGVGKAPPPPMRPKNASSTSSKSSSSVALPLASSDPNVLLDSLEALTSSRGSSANVGGDFDPIGFLNRHYTSESILVAQLPTLRESVAERMEKLDERISDALQRQSETAESTRRHVRDSKASVEALEHRIRLVQDKASQSERSVLEITKDMKRLDCAKRHLQRTITTLKRLHMLIHSVEQLRLACLQKPFPDYKSASHLVDVTRLLLKHFDAYMHKVEPMGLLSQKVNDLREDLRVGLIRGFRMAGFGAAEGLRMMQEGGGNKQQQQQKTTTDQPQEESLDNNNEGGSPLPLLPPPVMASGTLLIDSLGQEERQRFISQFCNDHLKEYKQQFMPVSKQQAKRGAATSFKVQQENAEAEEATPYCLDQVTGRFLFFRNLAISVNEKFPNVFPTYWNLHYSLTRIFLRLTREHFLALLDGPKKDKDAGNAPILLKAMQITMKFEKEMMTWLQRDFKTVFESPEKKEEKAQESKQQSPQKIPITGVSSHVDEEGKASEEQKEVESLLGMASTAFEKYMTPYIALEEQSLDEQLVEALEDKTVDTRGERPVFTSSTSLFVYIKGSISRCNALSKGYTFFLLHQAFRESLRKYAQVLSGKLPSPVQSSANVVAGITIASVSSTFGKQDNTTTNAPSYNIPMGEEVTVCHVISTCEYCADTVEALEDLVKDTIDERYKSKVDMMSEQDAFHELTAKSIHVLVSGLGNRVEGALKLMSSFNWGAFDLVGEESPYVAIMHDEIHPFVTTIRGHIPISYFRSFCDKFATAFSSTYYDALVKLKRINEAGTQQLLLDVYNLKTLFLKLPVLEDVAQSATSGGAKKAVASTIAPALYTKMVQKQFNKIETLLKLIGTPVELLIDVFKVQWVGGSALDLQTVMSLKGMKRTEQAAILEKIGLDPVTALKGATVGVTSATIVSERVQALQDRGQDVAAKVNSDLNQMRRKVDDFRRAFT